MTREISVAPASRPKAVRMSGNAGRRRSIDMAAIAMHSATMPRNSLLPGAARRGVRSTTVGSTCTTTSVPDTRAAATRRDQPSSGGAGVSLVADARGWIPGLEAHPERERRRRRTVRPQVLEAGDGIGGGRDRPRVDPPQAHDRLVEDLEELAPTTEELAMRGP